MAKRLQVLLDEAEYASIQNTARLQGLSVAEWVRQSLRNAQHGSPESIEAKLRAVAKAAQHEFPTADIDDMLREIDEGRGI